MPFGSTSAVYGWHGNGCLLKDIMVSIFLAPCCRYVDDFFGVDPAGCECTGRFCLAQICSLLGFATDPKKDADNAVNLAILGARVVVDTASCSCRRGKSSKMVSDIGIHL